MIVPSSASRGVREAPLPVVPGWVRSKVRVTVFSDFAGVPYSLTPGPGDFIHAGTSSGSSASAGDAALMPAAPSAARPFRKVRRVADPVGRAGRAMCPPGKNVMESNGA